MTTIAYRAGYLAADTRAYSGGKTPIGQKTKIFHDPELKMAGGVSSPHPGFGERFWLWLTGQEGDIEFAKDIEFTALTLQDGDVFIYENSLHPTGPLTATYYAIGSGREFALGAMEMGASAAEAVRVACKLDVWSADPIMVLDVRDPLEKQIERAILDSIVHPVPRPK